MVLLTHNGVSLVSSLTKHSLLQRAEDLGVLFSDSLNVLASLNDLKRKGKESRSLSLTTL